MPLLMKPRPDALDDYLAFQGQLQIGQITKRRAALLPSNQWLWALNGVPECPKGEGVSGVAATLDEAKAALDERWSKWLAAARLEDADAPPRKSGDGQ